MSDTRFTQGPWAVGVPAEGECQTAAGHYVEGPDGEALAFASRTQEDAQLIAAAPELYAALKAMQAFNKQIASNSYSTFPRGKKTFNDAIWADSDRDNFELEIQARAALAKARGKK